MYWLQHILYYQYQPFYEFLLQPLGYSVICKPTKPNRENNLEDT